MTNLMEEFIKIYADSFLLIIEDEDMPAFNNIINELLESNLTEDDIVEILRNVNSSLASDIEYVYTRKMLEKDVKNSIYLKLCNIYLEDYIYAYKKGKLDNLLQLKKIHKRPRIITRDELMGCLIARQESPVLIFTKYEGNDEIVKSIIEAGKEIFKSKKTNRIYKILRENIQIEMYYVLNEIQKKKVKNL